MKAFMTRLTSGIVLLAMIISVGLLGGWVLFAFTLTISLIGLWEFCRVFHLEKKSLGLLGLLFTVIYYLCVRNRHVSKYKTEEIMAAVFGMFYVTVMLSFIYLTREIPLEGVEGKFLFFLIFICSWGCDTCAYAVGMLLGRHKLAPVLSPKKSVEGGIGGVVGAALLGFLYGKFFMSHGGVCALICAVGAVVSQVGDLAASAIKRNHEIKDYGTLIPGHGGILDRFDSVIFTAPIIYVMAVLMMR